MKPEPGQIWRYKRGIRTVAVVIKADDEIISVRRWWEQELDHISVVAFEYNYEYESTCQVSMALARLWKLEDSLRRDFARDGLVSEKSLGLMHEAADAYDELLVGGTREA